MSFLIVNGKLFDIGDTDSEDVYYIENRIAAQEKRSYEALTTTDMKDGDEE